MGPVPPPLPDRYADARLVARGGMGEVWRARDTQLGREVALKLLVPGPGPEDEEVRRARFLREARAIAQVSSHPHVVTVYDVGDLGGLPWLAMEWLPRGSLADRMADGDVEPADALRWLSQVAGALDAAHDAGIVHRDVKPGNILFDAADAARIGDFGIARWTVESTPAALTQPGAVIGTAAYMSPEQARGEQVGAASDQYALMVICYELLVGARPFERDSAVAELAAHATEAPPAASLRRPDLPRAVDAAFERALAKQPEQRYGSCTAAVDALREALEEPRAGTVAPTMPLAARGSSAGRRRSSTQPVDSGGRMSIMAALVLMLLAALVLAALVSRDGDAGSSARPPASDQQRQPAGADAGDGEKQEQAEAARRARAIEQHERAFELLQQERYAEALELARDALRALRGVEPWEAYANYNVGASLVGLGRCAEALPYLERSQELQGQRDEIDTARAEAIECLEDDEGDEEGDEDDGDRKGKGRGKGGKRKD